MRIVISILAILFGLLHIVAAFSQFKSKDAAARGFAIAMASGGLCAIFAAAFHLTLGVNVSDASTAAVGCLLICGSAYANGKRAGNVHVSHHIVRGAVAALLVVGFIIW